MTLPQNRRRPVLFQLLLATALALALAQWQPFVGRALALIGDDASVPANTFSTLALGAPTALTGGPQGHDVDLSWGSGPSSTGYAIGGAVNGASSDCGAATFSGVGNSTAATYADAERYTPQGAWYCYQVTTTASTWSSQVNNPVVAVQLGFVASAVSVINGGDTAGCAVDEFGDTGALDCGDHVVVAFNQAVDTGTGPAGTDMVCAHDGSDTLWLGTTSTTGPCTAAESVTLGTLTGGSLGACDCRYGAAYAWAGDSRALTVTVGTRIEGADDASLSASAWTFTPSTDAANLLSATGGFHICDTDDGGGHCRPVTP